MSPPPEILETNENGNPDFFLKKINYLSKISLFTSCNAVWLQSNHSQLFNVRCAGTQLEIQGHTIIFDLFAENIYWGNLKSYWGNLSFAIMCDALTTISSILPIDHHCMLNALSLDFLFGLFLFVPSPPPPPHHHHHQINWLRCDDNPKGRVLYQHIAHSNLLFNGTFFFNLRRTVYRNSIGEWSQISLLAHLPGAFVVASERFCIFLILGLFIFSIAASNCYPPNCQKKEYTTSYFLVYLKNDLSILFNIESLLKNEITDFGFVMFAPPPASMFAPPPPPSPA